MAEVAPATVSDALYGLITASSEALNAYRAIFGKSCWKNRDRVAFRELRIALEAANDAALANLFASRSHRPHVSLRRRMADRELPIRLAAMLNSAPSAGQPMERQFELVAWPTHAS